MALRAKIKRIATVLDRRVPLFTDLVRRSAVLRWVLRRSRLVDDHILEALQGYFPLPGTQGFPKYAKFRARPFGAGVRMFFGLTHDHPALHHLRASIVFASERDEVVRRLKPVFVTQAPVTPPCALRALLPECVYWYEREVEELPARWDSLNVRFSSSVALPAPSDLPPGFRFHCVLVDTPEADSSARAVDLRHAGPYSMATAKGDA